MGHVVTFADLPASKLADGVDCARVNADQKAMVTEVVRVAPGKRWADTAPTGSDLYLFMLGGSGSISAGGATQQFPEQTFATVQEGAAFTVENNGTGTAQVLKVLAPPAPSGVKGFTSGLSVIERGKAPVKELPEKHKTRLMFVDDMAAHSERAHAMIVVYDKDTLTTLHQHPDAESLFVVLDGAFKFVVNGKDEIVKPGQAAMFGMKDVHGLCAADGVGAASFLEFHVPAKYTTVR